MMKRLIAAIAVLATPLTAAATPELAHEWGNKAASLHAQTTNLITAIDMGEQPDFALSYLLEIERFSVTASRLGQWIDTSNGASDLGCIFRGMAAEGEVQLNTLDGAHASDTARDALRRLAAMFADAEMIALASTYRRAGLDANRASVPQSCPANPASALNALE